MWKNVRYNYIVLKIFNKKLLGYLVVDNIFNHNECYPHIGFFRIQFFPSRLLISGYVPGSTSGVRQTPKNVRWHVQQTYETPPHEDAIDFFISFDYLVTADGTRKCVGEISQGESF